MNWFRLLFSRTCVIYGAGHRGHIPWRCETICCLPCNRWHGRSCSEHKHPTEGSDERGRWNIHVYTPYLLVEKKKTCLRSSVYKDRRNGFRSTRRLMEGKKSEGGSEQWRIARGSKPVGISKKKKGKGDPYYSLTHTHTLSLVRFKLHLISTSAYNLRTADTCIGQLVNSNDILWQPDEYRLCAQYEICPTRVPRDESPTTSRNSVPIETAADGPAPFSHEADPWIQTRVLIRCQFHTR